MDTLTDKKSSEPNSNPKEQIIDPCHAKESDDFGQEELEYFLWNRDERR